MILPDESQLAIHIGDWLILSGSQTIAVLADKDFPGPYEIVGEGTLTLTKQDQELLEATAGIGAAQSARSLIAAVQRLARIRIGDVTIPFTPGQLEEIAHRATKRGIPVARAVQEIIDRIKDELFWKS
jgi:hypothetical protein